MSWGKLWVRLKGELLTWKEDATSSGYESDQADALLKKLERMFATSSEPKTSSGGLQERAGKIAELMERSAPPEIGATGFHEQLREAYDDLRSLKGAGSGDSSVGTDAPEPNPRRLG
jgi:hypothetical protein